MERERMGMGLHTFTQVLRIPFYFIPRAQSPAMPLTPNPPRPAGMDADLVVTGVPPI